MTPSVQRVAVTGLGVLSPGGSGLEAYREWLDRSAMPREGSDAAEVPGFEPSDYVANLKLLRSMHRTFQLAAAGTVLSMRDAHIPDAESLIRQGIAPERAGVAAALADLSPLTRDVLAVLAKAGPMGAEGEIDWSRFAELSVHELHPFRRLTLLANMAAGHTSLIFGLQGPSFTFTTGATAGVQTLIEAFWTIAFDRADLMVCESADSHQQMYSSVCWPELAGGVVLESWECAQRRRASILAEVVHTIPVPLPPPMANEAVLVPPTVALLDSLLRLFPARAHQPDSVARISLADLARVATPADPNSNAKSGMYRLAANSVPVRRAKVQEAGVR